MAVQTRDFLAQLNPLTPINLGGGGKLDLERQQLELMRQQFEETKRKNAADDEYRKLAQSAATERAKLAIQKQTEQNAALAAAKNLEARQQAIVDINKAYDARDFGGMEVAAHRLNQLGGYARRLDAGDSGFPAWQVALEPPKTPPGLNPMDALGYGTLGTPDTLPETEAKNAEPLSTEEAFRRAGGVPEMRNMPQRIGEGPGPIENMPGRLGEPPPMQNMPGRLGPDPTTDEPDALTSEHLQPGGEASDQYGPPSARPAAPAMPRDIPGLTPGMTSFTPRRAPDAEDLTGGVTNDVPQDVINTAALQYQQEQRLGPVMSAMAEAYPQAYRGNVGKAGQAMLKAGMSPDKTMSLAEAARKEVAGAVEKERAQEFKEKNDIAEAEAKALAEEKDPIKRQVRIDKGGKRAKESFTAAGIKAKAAVFDAAAEITETLSNDDPKDDETVITLLMELKGQVGSQTEPDAMRMTGEGRASFVDTIDTWLFQIANSGFKDELKESIKNTAKKLGARTQGDLFDWIEEMANQAKANEDPLAGKGHRDFVRGALPKRILKAYDEESGGGEEEPAADDEEEPEEGASATIPETSRIASVHNNPGNLKFADQTGAEKGEPAAGGGNWAKFKTVEAGVAALRSQIERDAKAGLSLREFVAKYAPPTDGNDTEAYITQMAKALDADPDDPLSDVDLDAAVRFVAKKESSTEVGASPSKTKGGSGADNAEAAKYL